MIMLNSLPILALLASAILAHPYMNLPQQKRDETPYTEYISDGTVFQVVGNALLCLICVMYIDLANRAYRASRWTNMRITQEKS